MIGFLLDSALEIFRLPLMLLVSVVAALAAICGCVACIRCRHFTWRDLFCVRWLLRTTGHDKFDDFELLVHVHEATFECEKKMKVKVRVTAGRQVAKTSSSKGIFQSTLNVFVAQGTQYLVVELITESEVVLAQVKLNIYKEILHVPQEENRQRIIMMKQKGKGLLNPAVKLSMQILEGDEEEGLLVGGRDNETAFLMRQQLEAAEEEVSRREKLEKRSPNNFTEMEVLMQACAGPVQVFGTFGGTENRYIGVLGPPNSRRFILGIWKSQRQFEERQKEVLEILIDKIESVQVDPSRLDVFVAAYYDRYRVKKKLTCRIVDRPAKLWVDFIHLIITKVKDYNVELKKDSQKSGAKK